MEQEIDLRGYLGAIGRGWKWIVAGMLTILLLLALFYGIRAPMYQATALVVISRTQYELELEPRFRTVEDTQLLYRAYPEIALSDQVIQTLLANNPSLLPNMLVADIRGQLAARAGNDPSLIRLTVTHSNSQTAAQIANLWADLFIQQLNHVYGGESGVEGLFLEEQFAQAEGELQAAEAALVDFRASDQVAILQNQLDALTLTHAALLAAQSQTRLLLRDSHLWQEQLNNYREGEDSSVEEMWTTFLLQLRAYRGTEEVPIVWQVDGTTEVGGVTTAEQRLFLNGLISTLMVKASGLEEELQRVEEKLLIVQSQHQEAVLAQLRLMGEYELALEKRTTLARKRAESEIATADITQFARLASWAVPPTDGVNTYLLWRLLAGGLGTGLLGVAIVVGWHWWRGLHSSTGSG